RFAGFGKSEGLPGARIEALHESIDGTLWVGTRNGLARREGDRFVTVPLQVTESVVSRQGIASDAAGVLYIATERGLAVGTKEKFRLAGTPLESASVYVDASGEVWFGCGTALCRIHNGEAREIADGLPNERWDAILGDVDGNLWVRSEKSLYLRGPGARR